MDQRDEDRPGVDGPNVEDQPQPRSLAGGGEGAATAGGGTGDVPEGGALGAGPAVAEPPAGDGADRAGD